MLAVGVRGIGDDLKVRADPPRIPEPDDEC
jgi:hypothetical protein